LLENTTLVYVTTGYTRPVLFVSKMKLLVLSSLFRPYVISALPAVT